MLVICTFPAMSRR